MVDHEKIYHQQRVIISMLEIVKDDMIRINRELEKGLRDV